MGAGLGFFVWGINEDRRRQYSASGSHVGIFFDGTYFANGNAKLIIKIHLVTRMHGQMGRNRNNAQKITRWK